MKKLIDKVLLVVICTIASVSLASAQSYVPNSLLEEKILPVGEFDAINVAQDFEVSLIKGSYSAKLVCDKLIAPYVQVYVRSKTLFVVYDEKSVPKEIKNQYKGKSKPDPILRVTVYAPQLNGISLADKTTLVATDEFDGNFFTLTLADNAQVNNLTVRSKAATVNMDKNSQAVLKLEVDETMDISAKGNAKLKLIGMAESLQVNAAGNAELTMAVIGKTSDINAGGSAKASLSQSPDSLSVKLGGSANLRLNGQAPTLTLTTEKNSVLDATDFPVKNLKATMRGNSKADVRVEEVLGVSLTGGSSLFYSGTPVIQIEKIVKSTLAPAGTALK